MVSEHQSDNTVTRIVSGCRAGDRCAQRQLYEMFHPQVYRTMVRMVGLDEAPDLTQQVFLHVFRQVDKYAGRGQFHRWLYRVAMNEAYQHLRRRRRRRQGARPLAFEPTDPAPAGHERTERKELMEQALARLDPQLRSIFLLREIEELSYHDIGEALEVPEGTVGSRLHRARRELRRHLVDLGWEP